MGSVHISAKESGKEERKVRRGNKRKGIEAQRVKHPTLSWATNELIGDEEHMENKQKKIKGRKQGAGPQPSYPGPFSCFL